MKQENLSRIRELVIAITDVLPGDLEQNTQIIWNVLARQAGMYGKTKYNKTSVMRMLGDGNTSIKLLETIHKNVNTSRDWVDKYQHE